MRITNKLMVGNAVMHMDDNLERLNSLQEKIASGKQFQTMSDDPAKAASAAQPALQPAGQPELYR